MMKDTQMREKALIIVGVILVVIGLITGTFTTSQSIFFGLFKTTSAPYGQYMFPLIIVGIVLIVAGALMWSKK